MFDPVLLKTFVTLAETLNFTRAAELLQLSQPTVSQHVRKLESAAGRVLVARDTRVVRLTDHGTRWSVSPARSWLRTMRPSRTSRDRPCGAVCASGPPMISL